MPPMWTSMTRPLTHLSQSVLLPRGCRPICYTHRLPSTRSSFLCTSHTRVTILFASKSLLPSFPNSSRTFCKMQLTLGLLTFVVLLNLQGAFTCQSKVASAPVQTTSRPANTRPVQKCSNWTRPQSDKTPIHTVLLAEVEAAAFIIPRGNDNPISKEDFSILVATITNVSAMSSVMNDIGTGEERGNTVATILRVLDTIPELRAWLRFKPPVPTLVPEESNEQALSSANHMQRVFNNSAPLDDRATNAKLALHSMEQMTNIFREPTSDLARRKRLSAPCLLSMATLFSAIGRFVVRYERGSADINNLTESSDPSQIGQHTSRSHDGDYIRRVGVVFANLKDLLNMYRERGLEERLALIEPGNGTDCKHIYQSSKVDGGSCVIRERHDLNFNDQYLTFCVYPNMEESAAVPTYFSTPSAFLDRGTGRYVCELIQSCLTRYKSQLMSSYSAPYEAVIPRLYLSNQAHNLSTSWNGLLQTDIFPPSQNRMWEPINDKDAVMMALRSKLTDGADGDNIYSFYRESYNKTNSPLRREHQERFVQTLLANADRNLDYQVGLSPWYTRVNRFTDQHDGARMDNSRASRRRYRRSASTAPRLLTDFPIRFDDGHARARRVPRSTSVLPESLDYRSKNVISPVKDQGSCGSCYAFAAVGCMESKHALLYNEILDLSEQHILDCSQRFGNQGCRGGSSTDTFLFLQTVGVDTEDHNPYTAVGNQSCRDSQTVYKNRILMWRLFDTDLYDMRAALIDHGPIVFSLTVDRDFYSYGGGAFTPTSDDRPNAAVLIVGYGQENGHDVWYIKNSWGTNWGQEGFMSIQRNVYPRGIDELAYAIVSINPK